MRNQHDDGSWGIGRHLGRLPRLGKDAVSTLACVLALKTWNIGDDHIRKGKMHIPRISNYNSNLFNQF
jgi:hypothetical protein